VSRRFVTTDRAAQDWPLLPARRVRRQIAETCTSFKFALNSGNEIFDFPKPCS